MLRLSESKRLAKFAIVGGLNTGVDFAVFCALVYGLGFGSFWAQAISYLVGVANSYLLNRYWTFQVKEKQSAAELVRFIVINLLSFGASTLVLLSLESWGTEPALAKMISVVCSLAVNYIGYRLWVFRAQEKRSEVTSE
ncbi:GtrA family protein [Cohnella mopanensis]|uniref:GtrA family protein n=1 Tax=Cohnella mopanensis TaxID=2911966 RepID=UPI001EF8B598|nr:GtrA family protein [Cohnella mopanensis]